MVACLERAVAERARPDSITVDNGSEFADGALDTWAYLNHVKLDVIRPGKPVENGFIESVNGKLRDECLYEHEFINLAHARELTDAFRDDYNHPWPHSSLDALRPAPMLPLSRAAARGVRQRCCVRPTVVDTRRCACISVQIGSRIVPLNCPWSAAR